MNLSPNAKSWVITVIIVMLCLLSIPIIGSSSGGTQLPTNDYSAQRTAPADSHHSKQTSQAAQPKNCANASKLQERVGCFIDAYYSVKPSDTEATHRADVKRAAPFMSVKYAKRLYLGLDEESHTEMAQVNEARWNQHLTLKGMADLSKERKAKLGSDGSTVMIYVPVTVKAFAPNGTEQRSYRSEFEGQMKWQQKSGEWTLLGYTEVDPGSDGE